MPSIIGSKSCCAVNNRPAPTCAGTLAFALFFIRRLLFSHLGSGVVADPFSRSAWSRRYLLKFEFQQGVGHRRRVPPRSFSPCLKTLAVRIVAHLCVAILGKCAFGRYSYRFYCSCRFQLSPRVPRQS